MLVCEPSNVAQSQNIWSNSTFWTTFFLKEGMQKLARRDRCTCQNNAVGSALERQGLGVSFEGYYTFVEALDVFLSEVKEHAQP